MMRCCVGCDPGRDSEVLRGPTGVDGRLITETFGSLHMSLELDGLFWVSSSNMSLVNSNSSLLLGGGGEGVSARCLRFGVIGVGGIGSDSVEACDVVMLRSNVPADAGVENCVTLSLIITQFSDVFSGSIVLCCVSFWVSVMLQSSVGSCDEGVGNRGDGTAGDVIPSSMMWLPCVMSDGIGLG